MVRNDGQMLDVHSIFYTVQGEGPFSGMPAVFVRLAGCNLQCPNCFGVATKSRIPYLSRPDGPKVRLDDVKEGDVVLTFDQDMKLVETTVKRVLNRTAKKWLELTIAGRTYDVTPEHPFFTTRGLVNAEDLKVGDMILEARPEEIIAFKKTGDRNPMRNADIAARKTASTDYEVVAKKVSKTRLRKFKSGELVASFFTLTPDQQEEVRRKQSLAKRREKNPNWKGENPNLLDVQELVRDGKIKRCQECGKKKDRLLVHHTDGNHDNDDRTNLTVWCHRCHNQHHERGYNFWNGKRKDGKEIVKAHNGQEVQKIRKCRGELPVVNLSCAPHNTYLANGMFVHNCDTDYTTGRGGLTPDEIAQRVFDLSVKAELVVLTGGEPFRQSIGPLVWKLFDRGFRVQVETNGTVWLDDFPWNHPRVTVVCSPKTHVNTRVFENVHHWKYVIDHRHVDERTGLPTQVLGLYVPGVRLSDMDPTRIWISPMDTGDEAENRKNVEACVKSALDNGYRVSLQTHKLMGVP